MQTLRETSGLSREYVADALDRSYFTVRKWELGTSIPSVPLLLALADLYDVGVESLCEERAAG